MLNFTAITTFYEGRPSHGATLTPRFRVRWSGQYASRPWRITAQGVPVYYEKFHLHDITRRVRKYTEELAATREAHATETPIRRFPPA